MLTFFLCDEHAFSAPISLFIVVHSLGRCLCVKMLRTFVCFGCCLVRFSYMLFLSNVLSYVVRFYVVCVLRCFRMVVLRVSFPNVVSRLLCSVCCAYAFLLLLWVE